VAWESDDEGYRISALDIYNELGADGWELVSAVVRSSALNPTYGWSTASAPISTNAVLKRPVLTE
jgi:hypothetical protein